MKPIVIAEKALNRFLKPQILVYGNRKQDDMQFPFSTQAEKEAAFLKLFNYLRSQWHVYDMTDMSKAQKDWYIRADNGEGVAAIRLLTLRKTYEYEEWYIEKVPAKVADRISTPVAPKPQFSRVMQVSTGQSGDSVSVRLTLLGNKEVEFLLVPHRTTAKDWKNMRAASYFIIEALETEHKREMHNTEGLNLALSMVNELRVALHMALKPETASPTCTPEKVFERVMERAESIIAKYSHTPIEKLATVKRRPTTLSEAQEELAKANRCIGSLVHYLRKAGKTEEVQDVLRTYKLDLKEELV